MCCSFRQIQPWPFRILNKKFHLDNIKLVLQNIQSIVQIKRGQFNMFISEQTNFILHQLLINCALDKIHSVLMISSDDKKYIFQYEGSTNPLQRGKYSFLLQMLQQLYFFQTYIKSLFTMYLLVIRKPSFVWSDG